MCQKGPFITTPTDGNLGQESSQDVPDGVAFDDQEVRSHLDTKRNQKDSLREKEDLTSMQCKELGTDQLSKWRGILDSY